MNKLFVNNYTKGVAQMMKTWAGVFGVVLFFAIVTAYISFQVAQVNGGFEGDSIKPFLYALVPFILALYSFYGAYLAKYK